MLDLQDPDTDGAVMGKGGSSNDRLQDTFDFGFTERDAESFRIDGFIMEFLQECFHLRMDRFRQFQRIGNSDRQNPCNVIFVFADVF